MDPSAPGGESGGRTLALAFADGRLTAAGPPHRPVAAAVGGARAEDSGLPGLGFLLATLGFTVLAWSAATAAWAAGQRGMAVAALLGGLSLGPCLTAYVAAPRGTKPLLRRLVLSSGGLSILAPGLIDGTSLDLEGFFALLAAGTGGAAFGHSLMMLVLGLSIGMAVCSCAVLRVVGRAARCDGCDGCSRACTPASAGAAGRGELGLSDRPSPHSSGTSMSKCSTSSRTPSFA